jgi:hypothetical protein
VKAAALCPLLALRLQRSAPPDPEARPEGAAFITLSSAQFGKNYLSASV